MIKFGPVTVTHGSTNLGKTFGGGTLKFITTPYQEVVDVRTSSSLVTGIEGTLNFYRWPTAITITNSLQLYTYGIVTLTNSRFTITLYSCKIMLSEDFGAFGTNQQLPIKVTLIGQADGSGNIFKLE